MKPRVNELIAVTVTHPGSGERDVELVDVQVACTALKFGDPGTEHWVQSYPIVFAKDRQCP